MIILGGVPPHIEDPKPEFGEFLSALNQFHLALSIQHGEDEKSYASFLESMQTAYQRFLLAAKNVETTQHISAKGPQHNETKRTIHLENKDNFRMGGDQDHINGSKNAFANPKGIKAAILQKANGIDLSNYQTNLTFPFAAIHHIDQFEKVDSDPMQVAYFKPGVVTMMLNGDRIVLSPQFDAGKAAPYSLFVSGSMKDGMDLTFQEERLVKHRYQLMRGYNTAGGVTEEGKFNIFRPLANQKIYDYPSNIAAGENAAILLFTSFATLANKGIIAGSALVSATAFKISHYAFYVNDTTNTVDEVVGQTYLARYTTPTENGVNLPFNRTRTLNISDFFAVGNGAQIVIDQNRPPSITTEWRTINKELILNVTLFLNITVAGSVYRRVFSYSESVSPGTLVAGGVGAVSSVIPFVKETIDSVTAINSSKYLSVEVDRDVLDLNQPGIITSTNLVLHAHATRNTIKVKYASSKNTLMEKLLDPKLNESKPDQLTRTFSPVRYVTFGHAAERIIPLMNDAQNTAYLSFCLDETTGLTVYKELIWNTGTIHSINGNRVSIATPDAVERQDVLTSFPKALSALTTTAGGISLRSMCFTDSNNYQGYVSMTYDDGVVTLGSTLVLNERARAAMAFQLKQMEGRAKALTKYGNAVNEYPWNPVYGFHAMSDTEGVAWFSDGVSYVEGAVVTYSVKDGEVELSINVATTLTVLADNPNPVKGNLRSGSGDDYLVDHCDLHIFLRAANNFEMCLTKPFSNLMGSVSFSYINGVLRALKSKAAEPYQDVNYIDVPNDVYPPVLLPFVGIFQDLGGHTTGTNLTRTDSAQVFDPYLPSSTKYVIVPEGFSCILSGMAVVVNQTLFIPYTGTNKFFYLEQSADGPAIMTYDRFQAPSHDAVLIAIDTGDVLRHNRSYIVIDNKVIGSARRGQTIPLLLDDDTEMGETNFFQYKDVFRNPANGSGEIYDYHWIQQMLDGSLTWRYFDLDGVEFNPDNYTLENMPVLDHVIITWATADEMKYPYFTLMDTPREGNEVDTFRFSLDSDGPYTKNVPYERLAIAKNHSLTLYSQMNPEVKDKRIYSQIKLLPFGDWKPPFWMSKMFPLQIHWWREDMNVLAFDMTVDDSGWFRIDFKTGEVTIAVNNDRRSVAHRVITNPGGEIWDPQLQGQGWEDYRNYVTKSKIYPHLKYKKLGMFDAFRIRLGEAQGRNAIYVSQQPSIENNYVAQINVSDWSAERGYYYTNIYITSMITGQPIPVDKISVSLASITPGPLTQDAADHTWNIALKNNNTIALNNVSVTFTFGGDTSGDDNNMTFSNEKETATTDNVYKVVTKKTVTVSIPAGGTTTVPVNVKGNPKYIDGVEKHLNYDFNAVMLTDLTYGGLTKTVRLGPQNIKTPAWWYDGNYLHYNMVLPADGSLTFKLLTGELTTESGGWGGENTATGDFAAYPGPVTFNPGLSGQGYKMDKRIIPELARPNITGAPFIELWLAPESYGDRTVVTQQPNAGNDYTGIVRFYDVGKYEHQFLGMVNLRTPLAEPNNPLNNVTITMLDNPSLPTGHPVDSNWRFEIKNNGPALSNVTLQFGLRGMGADDESDLTLARDEATEGDLKYKVIVDVSQTLTLGANGSTVLGVPVFGNFKVAGSTEAPVPYDVNVYMTVVAKQGNYQTITTTPGVHVVYTPPAPPSPQ